jgi:serine/threonine protein kinase/tetratricopeptide (TPR) repeat protein
MNNARWERIQTIFHDAVARPESEQQAYLGTACAGDRGMMGEVLAMLKADSRGASLLDRGLPEVAYRMVGASLDVASFREFGPYRLQRILGEGGMGVVWLAEREDTGNLVAVKFLPHAGLSPARRERFAREIKTLAKLKHPYIARLYDAGALADGTPWFVMEYVEGLRFTEYCRQLERPIEERLRLFRKVCEAAQYAHGQEIVHRDLKPSNILVESDGTPRLLDFGIAKELQSLDETADQTRPGLRFLSPDYAAPEWVRDGTMGPYTDVYSLGVILYEILAGHLPKNTPSDQPVHTAGYVPGRPSVDGKHIASLTTSAWNDLDVLCMKAMHSDAGGRYQSVEALIRDIDHYLKQEPLDARPDTLRYRVGKFVARNRRSVVAASLTVGVVILLVVFFTLRLAKERNTALAEAARTRHIQRFMLTLFGAGDREAAPSNDLRVVTLLDRGAHEATVLNSDPETQAELYENLGRMYLMVGKFQQSNELLRLGLEKRKVTLGPENPKVADSLIEMGLSRGEQTQFKNAERLIREGLDIATRHLPPDDLTVLRARSALGVVLAESGSYDKAIALLSPIVKRPPTGEEGTYILLDSLPPLAAAEQNTGHIDVAESLNRRALALDRQLFGNSHPAVGFELAELASAEATLGRFPEAEKMYRETVAIYTAWYGRDNPATAQYTNVLARLLAQEGKYVEAAPMLQEVLPILEQAFGKSHLYVALALDSMGTLELMRGDLAAAQGHAERAVAIDKALFGDSNHNTAVVKAHLAQIFIKKEQYDRAEPLLRETVKALTERSLPGNLSVGAAQALLGRVLLREKHYRESEEQLTAAYAILAKQPGTSYLKMLQQTREDLATLYEALHQPDKAAAFRMELVANQPRKVAAPIGN